MAVIKTRQDVDGWWAYPDGKPEGGYRADTEAEAVFDLLDQDGAQFDIGIKREEQ